MGPGASGQTAPEVMKMDLDRLTAQEYNDYVRKKAKPSPIGKNMAWAFCTGGLICVIGQGLMDFYRSRGLDETMAGTAVSVTLIFAAALLTGPARGLWCPSRASPTRWRPRPWSSGARG